MEPADKPSGARGLNALADEFLPDADALERRLPASGSRATVYTLCALIGVALLWAAFSEVDRVVASRGRLVTPLPNLVVQPLEPGVLKSIDVRVGQVVRKGDVLALLDATFTAADAGQLEIRARALDARARRLELELAGKAEDGRPVDATMRQELAVLAERRATFDARMRQYDETIGRLKAAQVTNVEDQRALSDRHKSVSELEKMYRKLQEDKYGSRALVLSAADRRLEVERDLTVAQHRAAEIKREIAAAEAERATFTRSWRQRMLEELSETRQQRDEANQQLTKAQRREQLVQLVSPGDAVVLEIGKKSVGSVVKDGEPMFVLVPVDAELQAEVEVSPTDVGDLRTGDTVRIKIDAYPFQKHGTLDGKLVTIGADALSRPVAGGDSYFYHARIALGAGRLKDLPPSARLLPGMTLSAELVVGRRSVISYFLYPVIRILDESIRER